MWKKIKEYPSYEINKLGQIRSNKFKKSRLLKPQKDKYGYFNVRISNKNGFKTIKLHKLMAIEYMNHTPNGNTIIVDHIDNDKSNNKLDNLQLITQRENLSKDKKTENTGVYKLEENKYKACITINSKLKHLGVFNNKQDAIDVYNKALQEIEN